MTPLEKLHVEVEVKVGKAIGPGTHASILGSLGGMLWAFWLRPEWSIQTKKSWVLIIFSEVLSKGHSRRRP